MADGSGTNFTSSIFTRHLEELEELQSGASSFEETPSYGEEESSGEPSMEWRRQLLEESSTRVKQAKARTLDPGKVYEPGTLLFDAKESKYGRVKLSVPGYLVVKLVRGGEREYGIMPGDGSVSALSKGRTRGSKASAKAKSSAKARPAKAAKAAKATGIDDINGYIRSNFKAMSNRELARRTGLSEHTIRRKLGEWGLKRDKS